MFLQIKAEYIPKSHKEMSKIEDECALELKVSPKRLAEFDNGEFKQDDTSFCHVHCMAKKTDLFDDEKGINPENMLINWTHDNKKPVEAMKKLIADCIKNSEDKKEDKCLWAFNGTLCIKEAVETGLYRFTEFL